MQIQKLTVLDAARLAREIDSLRGATIIAAFRDESRTETYIELENPASVLKYHIDGRTSYLSVIDSVPAGALKMVPGLTGYSLTSVSQMNFDRIIVLCIEKKDRLGRRTTGRLIVELIPNTGNMLFTDNAGLIKGSLKRSSVRKYTSPEPLKKPSILNLEQSGIEETGLDNGTIPDRIYGLNRRDILNLSEKLANKPEEEAKVLQDYAERAMRPGPAWMVISGGSPAGYSLVEPSLTSGESSTRYDSALVMYEAYYGRATTQEGEERRLESMKILLGKEIRRQRKKVDDLIKAVERNQESLHFKKFGELILANIGQIKKGNETVNLADIDAPSSEMIEIQLDPARSPAANAEAYFKKYRKAIASEKILGQRLKAARNRLERLQNVKEDCGHDIDLLESELQKIGIIGASRESQRRKKQERRKPFRTYRASCGWEILVGKTNIDNDELTFKIAAKDDIWLHAWQAAGSHTILRLPSRNAMPDRRTLQEAASLAAYFSKARRSSKVPVIYTQIKYVRKPRKAPPGKVIVEREKQLMVKPGDPDDFTPEDGR
jgi:predicted ribosome quality control (RQC) complex YloA/Tae2 family protein